MSTGFDPVNMFWKMLLNAQEMNQLALKVFLNSQKIQQWSIVVYTAYKKSKEREILFFF